MDSSSPTNLDHPVPPQPARSTGPAYLVSRLISSYIGYLLVMGVLVLLVPRFEPALVDKNFKLNPPAVTVLLLSTSMACVNYYLWAFLLPVPALWAVLNFNIIDKTRRRRLRLGAFFFVVAFLIFTLVALFPILLQGSTSATQQ